MSTWMREVKKLSRAQGLCEVQLCRKTKEHLTFSKFPFNCRPQGSFLLWPFKHQVMWSKVNLFTSLWSNKPLTLFLCVCECECVCVYAWDFFFMSVNHCLILTSPSLWMDECQIPLIHPQCFETWSLISLSPQALWLQSDAHTKKHKSTHWATPRICVCLCVCVFVYIPIYIHAHTQTHTEIRIHTQGNNSLWSPHFPHQEVGQLWLQHQPEMKELSGLSLALSTPH